MQLNKEEAWDTNNAVVVSAAGRERCTRRLARNARKNAKFLSSREKTVRYIAKTVFRSEKTAVDKFLEDFVSGSGLRVIRALRERYAAAL